MSPTDPLIFSISSNSLAVGATCTMRWDALIFLHFYIPTEDFEGPHIVMRCMPSNSWV